MSRKAIGPLLIGLVVVGGLLLVYTRSDRAPDRDDILPAEQTEDMSAVADDLDTVIAGAIEEVANGEAVLLDVRTDAEWVEQHARDAVHFGLEEKLKQGELPAFDKDAEMYVYCRGGTRAGEAIRLLQAAGFTNLTNLGGLDDWIRNKGPVVVDTPAS